MRCHEAVQRLRGSRRRSVDAVFVALICACDSGSFGSHSDRGPVRLAVTAQPTAAVADEAIGPVAVTVQDAYGNAVPSARVSITIAIGDNPGGATLSGTTTLVAAGGVAVFSDLVIDRGGSGYTLTAEASGLTRAASEPIDVRGPVKLAFIAQPTAALAGAVMRPLVIAVQDKDGNNMPNAHASITVAIGTNPGGGTLSGTSTLPVVGGVAVFSDLVIDNPGSGYMLTAEASGLTKATSRPIEVTVAPTATQLAFAVQPGASASVFTRQAMSPAVQVSILDDLGNVVTSSTMDVTVAIAAGPAGATLSGTSTVAAVNGVATFADLSVDIAGVYTLAASACSLTRATSTPFNVTPFLYVANFNTSETTVYAGDATGNAAPIGTIDWGQRASGPGLAFDGAGRLYVVSLAFQAIFISAAGLPTVFDAMVAGTNTGLAVPQEIAFDGAGRLYVANRGDTIMVYAAGATGNVTPIATIAGTNTGLSSPWGLALDGAGRIYVANEDSSTVTVYAAGATGNVTPTATIAGTNTGLNGPSGLAFDGEGRLYVANYNYGNAHTITVYAAGATGNVTPIGTVAGTNTGLNGPSALALDGAGRLYVANYLADTITVYAAGATGNATPIATIAGANTGLSAPDGLAIH